MTVHDTDFLNIKHLISFQQRWKRCTIKFNIISGGKEGGEEVRRRKGGKEKEKRKEEGSQQTRNIRKFPEINKGAALETVANVLTEGKRLEAYSSQEGEKRKIHIYKYWRLRENCHLLIIINL